MDAVTSKRQKKMSQRQERRVAEDIGGRTVAGSGAGRTSGGGDVRKRSEIRVECKVTEKDYFVLQFADLRKIADQAIKGGLERPIMQIRFAVPRSMVFEYAVEPGASTNLNMPPYKGRKRIKVRLSDLQRELLHYDSVTVAFEVGSTNIYWRIKPWTSFLKELEQHADDQHNS